MNIKLEIIANELSNIIRQNIESIDIDIDLNELAETKSTKILNKIQEYIKDDTLSDFEIVEKIVVLFEKNNIDCGGCHDF